MIRFENVVKRYRGTAKPALEDVDFEVLRGEFVFLVGASGSGKSTCLRLILREELPSKGRVVALGRDTRSLSNRRTPYFRRSIGAVFQDFRLLPSKTVFQNVAFALQVIGASRAMIKQAVPDALERVGLAGMGKRMPHELSGGEQQRVAFARALVNRPQVLLADEPTGNLDPATSVDIMRLLAQINAGGTTVVMATHEAAFVDQMQRRVIELVEGRMVRDERHGGYGDTGVVEPLQPEVERGTAAIAALTAVLEVQREVSGSGHDPAAAEERAADPEAEGTVESGQGAESGAEPGADAGSGTRSGPGSSSEPAPSAERIEPAGSGTTTSPAETVEAAETAEPAETAPGRTADPRERAATDLTPGPGETTDAGGTVAPGATAAPGKAAAGEDAEPDERAATANEPREPFEPPAPDAPPEAADPDRGEAAPRSRALPRADVDLDELGVADRLGLSDDDEEVGPTS